MNKENKYIMQLESYWFDKQYQYEKYQDIEKLNKELSSLSLNLVDFKHKNRDSSQLQKSIEVLRNRISAEENSFAEANTKLKLIEEKINEIKQPYKNILYLKYIKNYSFDSIAAKMNYSSKRIYQLHKEGLNIYKNLCENEDC